MIHTTIPTMSSALMADGNTKSPKRKSNRTWLYIFLGCLGLPLVLGFICFGLVLFTGFSVASQLEQFSPELATIIAEAEAGGSQPIITLVPTADLSVLFTPTPEPTPLPTFTPTPLPAPATGSFTMPQDGDVLNLNEFAQIEFIAQDNAGITNIQIIDNGQTLYSQGYSGDNEITYTNNWSPVADGRHFIQVEVTDRTGEREIVASISVRVIDQAFMAKNAETFSRVQNNVSAIRGLALKEEITPYLMGEGELRRYLRADGYTPEEAQIDSAVLSAFNFVDLGYDLYEAATQYAGISIAGFYDPRTKDFVLISNDNDVNALEEYVYAHEMMHALQDQHFTLHDLTNEGNGFSFEQSLALRALAEGEADLLQEIYFDQDYFSYEEQVEIFNVAQTLRRPVQTTIDPVQILVETFAFPYEKGVEFVRAAYNRNGWDGVTAMWENLPQSTEHILHPEKYFAGDQPQVVSIVSAEAILSDWMLVRDDVFGEFYLEQFLSQQVNANDAAYAANGWGGDRYQVYIEGDPTIPNGITRTALIWRLAWDSPTESDQFAAVFKSYADSVYGTNYLEDIPGAVCRASNDVICTYPIGDEWLVVRGPDIATVNELINLQLNAAPSE